MSLWGTTDGTKPKFLTDEEKKLVFANASGWVLESGSESAKFTGNNNPDAQPEVLVAIGSLATRIGAATITEIEWVTTAFDKSDGGTLDIRVRYNEEVVVTGSPRFLITNQTSSSRNITLNHHSGSGTNELVFRKTIAAGNAATNAGDVLKVVANPISQHSGSTIKDKTTSENAEITSSLSIGTAAGTLTVAA
mgnify:CR=1 FL=1|tara:strand:+ start:348 stop:926 length:579 start_codon:yes stop_codon:yes gene_type:complete